MDDTKDIRERLVDPDDEVRRLAVIELTPRRDDEARSMLVQALGDESWRVRKVAGEQLLAFGRAEAVVADLVVCLADGDNAGLRNAAAETLARLGSPATAALCRSAKDPDRDVRKFSVDILGEIGEAAGVEILVDALQDEDENVRVAAAEALGRVGGDRARDALAGGLDREDLMLRATVLDALARLGAELRASQLEPFLDDPILRRPALLLLGRSPDPEAVDLVVRRIGDRRRGSREAAIVALDRLLSRSVGQARREEIRKVLAEAIESGARAGVESALQGGDRETRCAAARVFGFLAQPESAPSLLRAAADEQVRREALRAIKQIGGTAAPVLIGVLADLAPEEQVLAYEVLAQLGDARAAPALIEALEEPDDQTRRAAALALGGLGDASAIGHLAALLGADDAEVVKAAIDSLVVLARTEQGAVVAAAQAAYKEMPSGVIRRAALQVLARAGGEEQIALMLSALHQDEPESRIIAIGGLRNLHQHDVAGQGLDAIVGALTDENADVRTAAADALGEIGDKRAVEALVSAVQDDNVLARVAAIRSLGRLADPAAAQVLKAMVRDAVGLVAIAAIEALSCTGAGEFLEVLDACLAQEDPEVLKETARALRGIADHKAEEALLALLGRDSWEVRSAAARALGERGATAAIPSLRSRLEVESDDFVRATLRDALAALGEPTPGAEPGDGVSGDSGEDT